MTTTLVGPPPLSDAEFVELATGLGLTQGGIDLVQKVRHSEPGGGGTPYRMSVAGRFVSQKMLRTLYTEARSTERRFYLVKDRQPDTLEMWDQPPIRVPYRYVTDGKERSGTRRQDALLIERTGIWIVQCKTEQELKTSSREKPGSFEHDGTRWTDPTAERWLAQFGIKFLVFSSADVPDIVVTNEEFIKAFRLLDAADVPDPIRNAVLEKVRLEPATPLSDLYQLPEVAKRPDPVLAMVVLGEIFVDETLDRFDQPEKALAFIDADVAEAFRPRRPAIIRPGELGLTMAFHFGARLLWDGKVHTVVNPGDWKITLDDGNGTYRDHPRGTLEALVRDGAIRIESTANTPAELELDRQRREIAARFPPNSKKVLRQTRAVLAKRHGEPVDVPRSTLARWTAEFEAAEALYGNGVYGLIPMARSGNPFPGVDGTTVELVQDIVISACGQENVPDEDALVASVEAQLGEAAPIASKIRSIIRSAVSALVDEIVKTDYETAIAPSQEYIIGLATSRLGPLAPSETTIRTIINARPKHAQELRRRGIKGALPWEPETMPAPDAPPIHGSHLWAVGYLDCTESDQYVTIGGADPVFVRRTKAVLKEGLTGRVVAYACKLGAPNEALVMAVIEVCLERWHRFFEELNLDWGSENHATDLEMLLAGLGCAPRWRPPSRPRFGSIEEADFGATDRRLLHNSPGNTKALQKARTLTPEVDPRTHAIFNWEEGVALEEDYYYNVHPTIPQLRLGGLTIAQAWDRAPARTGFRNHLEVDPADPLLRILLLPTVAGRTRTASSRGTVTVDYVKYKNDRFKDLVGPDKELWLKRSMKDIRIVWANIDRKWVAALAPAFAHLRPITLKELKEATAVVLSADYALRRKRTAIDVLIAEYIERKTAEARERIEREATAVVEVEAPLAPPIVSPSTRQAPGLGWHSPLPAVTSPDRWVGYRNEDGP